MRVLVLLQPILWLFLVSFTNTFHSLQIVHSPGLGCQFALSKGPRERAQVHSCRTVMCLAPSWGGDVSR
jgi:hypothetical protein